MTEHSGERPPETRMRESVVWQSVGANHGFRIREDALNVALVHDEVDCTGRLKRLQQSREFAATFLQQFVHIASAGLGRTVRPGDQRSRRLLDRILAQHGRGSHVGITIQADVALFTGAINQREGLG